MNGDAGDEKKGRAPANRLLHDCNRCLSWLRGVKVANDFQPVAANDGCPWEGEAVLRANDVNNALALVVHPKVGEAELTDILFESQDLADHY